MNLTTLCQRLALDLDDAAGETWSAGELERAARRALHDYSTANPRRLQGDLTLLGDDRLIDVNGLAGLLGVERVWYPYAASELAGPPRWQPFELWPGGLLYLKGEEEPSAGETARLFYWALHSLAGLDEAEETSVPAGDEELLALGAAGYAALEKARRSVGSLGVSSYTPLHWRAWAEGRMALFAGRLEELRRRAALSEAGPVGMG